jgi:UDP-glucose 4-epimerase
MNKTVAITGVNGYAASTLLPLLEADPDIGRIIGIDVRPWKGGVGKVEFIREDIRSGKMADILREADIICHLVSAGDGIHNRLTADDININGLKNILSVCGKCRVKKVIIGTCTSLYGFQNTPARYYVEDDAFFDESTHNYFAETAVKSEIIANEFIRNHPEITVTILRLAPLMGANLDNILEKCLSMQMIVMPAGDESNIQFIYEADLASALFSAVKDDLPGAYNVASDDSISLKSCFRKAGVTVIPLPRRLAKCITGLGFHLRIYPLNTDFISLLEQSICVGNEKLKTAAGWKPVYTSETALLSFTGKMRERRKQDNLLQAVLSWIIKSGKRLKPFILVLSTFRIGKIPGLRRLVPWLNPDNNSINYLPVNETIDVESKILPSQVVHDLIESASIHVIMDKCGCRMLRGCTRYTHEVGCLFMGETALKLPHGVCQRVSRDAAHAHAERAMRLGLLPMIGKVRIDNFIYMTPDKGKLLSLCFCCDCCCILTSYKHVPGKYLDGIIQPINGLSIEVTDKCSGCGACLETCAFNAITIVDGHAVHNQQCRGCGRCERFCPENAVKIAIQNADYADEINERIRSYVTF